jgi:hypothetical protein
MSDEWGPWIEHDGKGCPVPLGVLVEALWRCERDGDKYRAGQEGTTAGIVTEAIRRHPAWVWDNFGKRVAHPSGSVGRMDGKFIRYRIRRPRALQEMIRRAADLDAPAPQEVTA